MHYRYLVRYVDGNCADIRTDYPSRLLRGYPRAGRQTDLDAIAALDIGQTVETFTAIITRLDPAAPEPAFVATGRASTCAIYTPPDLAPDDNGRDGDYLLRYE